jgi:myo-inositol-1(or 4)-monophosphatase
MHDDLDTIRAGALTIAHDAGALLLEGWRRAPRVTKKGAIDLVTDFDLRCEAQLRAHLARAFPAHSVVAEEGAAHDGAHDGPVWYVDPIDGTTNFAHGHFFFAISLGLVVDGTPVVGVVHAPALGTTWHGAVGHGAWRRGPDGVDVPCATSRVAVLDDALLATGFPYDRRTSPENNLREFAALKLRAQGIRRCGAASLDLCLVADGTYDGYWEQKLAPWDLAGGTALLRAAGGMATDYAGGALDVRAGRVVATNGPLHPALVAALAEVRAPMSER